MAIYIKPCTTVVVDDLSLQPMKQYIITTMFDPTSPYCCMARWHDYRILLISTIDTTSIGSSVLLCLVALHGD